MGLFKGYKKVLAAVIGLGISAVAGTADAGYTTINAPAVNEKSQAEILSNTYGGVFVADGLNYTNGFVTAVRIDDDHDQHWSGRILGSRTLGVFAGYEQGMAYGDGPDKVELFSVTGSGFSATGGTGMVDLPGTVEFFRTGTSTHFSSVAEYNVDKMDHLVTYLIQYNDIFSFRLDENEQKQKHVNTYVLFWEDLSKKAKADFDFNDLAVEMSLTCDPVVVPLPAAAWSGLSTLLAGAGFAGYRKMRRKMA